MRIVAPVRPALRRGLCALGFAVLAVGTSYRSASATTDDALPRVRVKNIGLHIGGGPNDAATKAPFLRQIAAHFDAFRRCYGSAEPPSQHGTFGIDLLVPREGGVAAASNSRTNMKGQAFRDCVVNVFSSITFERPRRGATKLSYALSFEPE